MAALEHFERRLMNWDQLLSRLVTTLRVEGAALDISGSIPPFLQALITRLAAERPSALDRFFKLWPAHDKWRLEMRNYHPIEWRLGDGTILNFFGVFRDWSIFDGSHVFDWMPADAATSTWTEDAVIAVGKGGTAPGIVDLHHKTFPRLLAEARDANVLTRPQLGKRAGVSADSIYAYESGRRLTWPMLFSPLRQSCTTSPLYSSVNERRGFCPSRSIWTSFLGSISPYPDCPSNRGNSTTLSCRYQNQDGWGRHSNTTFL